MDRPNGIDWYIKWIASVILIFGAASTSMNMYPYNMYLQFTGVFGWLIVGIIWRDWALIVVNTIGSLVLLAGIIHYLTLDWYLIIYETYIEAKLWYKKSQSMLDMTFLLMVKKHLFMHQGGCQINKQKKI